MRPERDRIVRLADGRLALQEYKTTTKDTAPGGAYWARLRLDQQVSRYMLAARAEGLDYRYWDDDDGSEFNKLAADGLPILVTSLTDKTSRQVASETRKAEACGL